MLNTTWSRRRFAAVLALLVSGVGLPVGMAVSNKSAPVFLAVASAVALVALWIGGPWDELLSRYRGKLRTPIAVAALVFAAVAISSLTWSVDRETTLRSLVATLAMAYVGLVAASALPLVAGRSSGWILVTGLTVGTLVVVAEATLGMPLHGWLGQRTWSFELKRSLIALVLLFWPAAGFLLSRGRGGWAAGLGALVFAATQLVGAGTAALGLAMGAIAFGGARFAPRRMLVAAMFFVALSLAVAPFTGSLASHLVPRQVLRLFVRSHAAERIDIWRAFETRFLERPTLGYGFNASPAVATAPRAAGAVDDRTTDAVIEDLHPHNSFLQIWVEGGIVGALAAVPLFIAIFFALSRMPRARLPVPLALLLASTSMALVGFGLWQPWWSASVASAIIWLTINDRAAETVEKTRG